MAYPSFYEGFGIPPLKHLLIIYQLLLQIHHQFQKLLAMQEVLFNPFDVKIREDKIINVLNSNDLKTDLIAKGKERLNFLVGISVQKSI